MVNARAYSGSTTSGGSSGSGTSGKREGNDGKDQKQKDNNTDKQIGMCLAGAGLQCGKKLVNLQFGDTDLNISTKYCLDDSYI